MAFTADISKPEDVQKMVDAIVSKWAAVHIACNNAGINMNSASEDTSLEEWDKTFSVNLRGTFICCQVGDVARSFLCTTGHFSSLCVNLWKARQGGLAFP